MHLACLAVIWVRPTPAALGLCAALYLVRMFGITAGYHRYFAHRAYKTSRAFQFVLAWLGCCAAQKGPLWWAAHHRQHHRHSDTEDDPHSPILKSIWWAHVGWVLSPENDETSWRLVRDWSRYPELRWINRNHWVPGFLLALGCYFLAGWPGLVWGFFVSTVLLYHGVFTVNSLCHLFGKRRFATTDQSRNNALVAVITLGEGWHNNHHHDQAAARQGLRWWEVDVTYYIIRGLALAGIVWGVRDPSRSGHVHRVTAKPKKGLRVKRRRLRKRREPAAV